LGKITNKKTKYYPVVYVEELKDNTNILNYYSVYILEIKSGFLEIEAEIVRNLDRDSKLGNDWKGLVSVSQIGKDTIKCILISLTLNWVRSACFGSWLFKPPTMEGTENF